MDDVRFVIRELEQERERLKDALQKMDENNGYDQKAYDYVACAYNNIGLVQVFIQENLEEKEG